MQSPLPYTIAVGTRGNLLASMHEARLPIPPGFIIGAQAFSLFCETNDIDSDIATLLPRGGQHSETRLKEISKMLRKRIREGEFPDSVVHQILTPYIKMGEPRVMLFPSTHSADSPGGNVELQMYGVSGDTNLFEAIKELWGRFFSPKLLGQRQKFLIDHLPLSFAIAVQTQPLAKVSAIIFTDDLTSGTKQTALIKAVYGEGALDHELEGADYYWIQRGSGEIYKEVSDTQRTQIAFEHSKPLSRKTAPSFQKKRKLSTAQIIRLGKLAKDLQHHFFFPQKAVVFLSGENFWIVSTEALQREPQKRSVPTSVSPAVLSSGDPAQIIMGMQYALNVSGHLPSVSRIAGSLYVSASLILSRYPDLLSGQKKKLLEYELSHSLEFLGRHVHAEHGLVYLFDHSLDDHDQIDCELASLSRERRDNPNIPLTLLARISRVQEYSAWMTYWRSSGLVRSSHLHYGCQIATPAAISMISEFVSLGMDMVCIDLDAIETALHGSLSDLRTVVGTPPLVTFLQEAVKICETQGVMCHWTSTRKINRDMLGILSAPTSIEWIAPSSLYIQLHHTFGEN